MLNNPLLKILNYDPGLSFGIGSQGTHLTIVILSLERAELTIKLLSSFKKHVPFFKGKFLILDNGSKKNTRSALHDYIQNSKQHIKLIEAKTNLGVAGGRNYAVQYVTTPWMMFLDNDIYLDGNFLPNLHDEVNQLGAHFISIPLKNPNGSFIAKGGRLYINNIHDEYLHISGGSAEDSLDAPFIGAFLFGGAAILNVETFKLCGMFNQDLFVGYEDTEFSIRLWKKGYKIGNSTVKCFIHDHPIATETAHIDYEKKRFSYEHIMRSSKSAETIHYFKFMTYYDLEWLKSKLKHYIPDSDKLVLPKDDVKSHHHPTQSKLSVAIITDIIGWAFDNIAFNLTQLKQDIVHFEIIPLHDPLSFKDNVFHALLAAKDCQIIHFMWRGQLFNLNYNLDLYTRHLDTQTIKSRYLETKILSTCVYDHALLPSEDRHVYQSFRHLVKQHYYVSSPKLFDIYANTKGIKQPLAICPDGVDLNLFKPGELSKQNTIKIGWAGNSAWGEKDHKGLFTIIKPAIERLMKAGYPLEFSIADSNITLRQQHEMPDFYREQAIILCASLHEGTPNIVLEAMACGCAVITTDVGIVREALGQHQQAFIVDRTVDAFYTNIKYLLEHHDVIKTLRMENLNAIKTWCWTLKANNLLQYFITLAKQHGLQSPA